MADRVQVAHFEANLEKALQQVRVVLDATKHPRLAGHVHHQYQDKYLLAEIMTNTAAASQVNCLAMLGLSIEQLEAAAAWSQASSVSFQFKAEERCSFLREETKEVESATKHVEELSVAGTVRSSLTSKTVTKKTEFFWKLEVEHELSIVRGTGSSPEDRRQLCQRSTFQELITSTKETPHPEARIPAAAFDVNISWLMRQLREGTSPTFKIDRAHPKCCTPRRNADVAAAIDHFSAFCVWSKQVCAYLISVFNKDPRRQTLDLKDLYSEGLFIPVLPLFDDSPSTAHANEPASSAGAPVGQIGPSRLSTAEGADGSPLLKMTDANLLLSEETRTLQGREQELRQALPAEGLISAGAVFFARSMLHCCQVATMLQQALDYIEDMIFQQLIAAIGKEVTPKDLNEYMIFHNRKLFREAFAPVPFCFAVRRSECHSPEGTLSLEQTGHSSTDVAQPIVTLAAKALEPHPMQFALSASAMVTFHGERYLHAWLRHEFSGDSGLGLSLVSRARQFSSMLVLVGRIASATAFDPKYAAIVQNKDEITIPLEMSTIPTPKEFRDAIESLSPEQQRFAKAFREMQLESTLFGVLVIQIKPQLEKVLNLPSDSLTKEIKLTQDLMQLFMKYQIPSDLMSFDEQAGPSGMELVDATPPERLEAVKGHVTAMRAMIDQAQREEIEERNKEARYARPRQGSEDISAVCFSSPVYDCDMMMPAHAPAPMMMMMMEECAMSAPEAPMLFSAAPRMLAAAAPVPAPVPQSLTLATPGSEKRQAPQQHERKPQPLHAEHHNEGGAHETTAGRAVATCGGTRDYTKVPKELDMRFEELDTDAALRPTIINPSSNWTKREQKALLAEPTRKSLDSDDLKREKDAAFDLLDALTKSGALPVDDAVLHVVIAATHCFDKTVMETVVQDNVSPIDKVERSTLIMASTIHQQPVAALINETHCPRVCAASPMLFDTDRSVEA